VLPPALQWCMLRITSASLSPTGVKSRVMKSGAQSRWPDSSSRNAPLVCGTTSAGLRVLSVATLGPSMNTSIDLGLRLSEFKPAEVCGCKPDGTSGGVPEVELCAGLAEWWLRVVGQNAAAGMEATGSAGLGIMCGCGGMAAGVPWAVPVGVLFLGAPCGEHAPLERRHNVLNVGGREEALDCWSRLQGEKMP
jgi:hypothetical protein